MTPNRQRSRLTFGAVFAAAVLTACGTPGASSGGSSATSEAQEVTDPITAEQVADLGDVTLAVWADAGEEQTLADFVPAFEERYPNVEVEVAIKGFDDLIRTVVNAMNSDSPPDVAQGNQGYAVDGALVEAGLLRPLDDVAEAYGWTELYAPGSLAPFRWDDDGRNFGEGRLFGNAPITQYIGVYYNEKMLSELELTVPESFAEFESTLAEVDAAGTQPIMFGNAEQYPAIQVYGAVAGAFVPAEETNAWVNGADDATFVTDGNREAATTMARWAEEGYFGDGFDGVSADDAMARFASGEGAFYIGGVWNNAPIVDGPTADAFGFVPMPPGETGEYVATGSLGLGWHISAKTEVLPAAAAFVGELHSADYAQSLTDQGRLPVASLDVEASDPLLVDQVAGAGMLLDDDGQTAYLDWATDTMYTTFGARAQELLAGRLDVDGFLDAVQTDWLEFHEGRG